MNERPRFPAPWTARGLAVGLAALAAALSLSCHSGTPAAPMGTSILASFEFVDESRNVQTGDFQAVIGADLIDMASGVPQVGVQVRFLVTAGDASFETASVVTTNGAGHAETVISARGARDTASAVTVRVISGEAAEAEVSLTVFGGSGRSAQPPEARFTFSPANPSIGDTVTVDVADSTDPDCPTGEPDSWEIDWDDMGALSQGTFEGVTTATHQYNAAGSYQVTVTVENCVGLSDSVTQTVQVQ